MLDTSPIIEIKGIGEKTEKLFHKLNIFTVGDLLSYYPRDYETFKEPVPIMQAPVGELCAVRACVTAVPNGKKDQESHRDQCTDPGRLGDYEPDLF